MRSHAASQSLQMSWVWNSLVVENSCAATRRRGGPYLAGELSPARTTLQLSLLHNLDHALHAASYRMLGGGARGTSLRAEAG